MESTTDDWIWLAEGSTLTQVWADQRKIPSPHEDIIQPSSSLSTLCSHMFFDIDSATPLPLHMKQQPLSSLYLRHLRRD
jgi:hypothetical protein